MKKEDFKKNTDEMPGAEIESLKTAYNKIKIPEGLKSQVLKAVETGKAETESEPKRKETLKADAGKEGLRNGGGNTSGSIKKLLLRTGQTAAAALLAITVLANSGAGVAYAMEQIPVIGAITKVVTFRTYEKKDGNTEAKVEVPRVEPESGSAIGGAAAELNKSVEEYTDQIIAQFEADVKAGGGELHKGLYSNYEVVTDNDKLFTLRINTTEVMASGAESVKIYNIDKKTDRILTLKDMFPAGTDYVGTLSSMVKAQMEAEMNADEGKVYFLNDGMGSDFEAIKENQNFYINESGHMVLVFDEYEVAPGFMGVVEIEISGMQF